MGDRLVAGRGQVPHRSSPAAAARRWRCDCSLRRMPAQAPCERSCVPAHNRAIPILPAGRRHLVAGKACYAAGRHHYAVQGRARAAAYGGDRDAASWRGTREDRLGPAAPRYRHDCLLRQGRCRAPKADRAALAGGALMLKAIEAYLDLRRATGFAMSNAEYLLKSFAAFAAERGQTHIHSDAEFNCLIEAALRLGPKGGLRSLTYASLIALLSATGLRISEALKLTVADVTRDGLLIRETKFRKTRLVPLHDTAAAGLRRYLARRRPRSNDDPVFIGKHGGTLRYIAVKETFDRLVRNAGIAPTARRRPRLHDLRHTFAVRALQGSPAGRSRSGAHMAALSTYMGHVNIYATYWYLEATADLMRDVAAAGEDYLFDGRRS